MANERKDPRPKLGLLLGSAIGAAVRGLAEDPAIRELALESARKLGLTREEAEDATHRASEAARRHAEDAQRKVQQEAHVDVVADAEADVPGAEPSSAASEPAIVARFDEWDRPIHQWALALKLPPGWISLRTAFERWQMHAVDQPLAEILLSMQCMGYSFALEHPQPLPLNFALSARWVVDPRTGWARRANEAPMLQYAFFVAVPEHMFMQLAGLAEIDPAQPLTQAPPPEPAHPKASISPASPGLSCTACSRTRARTISDGDQCQFNLCDSCIRLVIQTSFQREISKT